MGGLHWYHAHVHGSTRHQVVGGAFGLIVVEDQPRRKVFLHDSAELDGVWRLLTSSNREKLLLAFYDVVTGKWQNGVGRNHSFLLERGEWYRFRVLTQNTLGIASQLSLPRSCDVFRLAHDGVYLFLVPGETSENLSLTGASRIDLAVRCNSSDSFTMAGTDVVGFLSVDDVQVLFVILC